MESPGLLMRIRKPVAAAVPQPPSEAAFSAKALLKETLGKHYADGEFLVAQFSDDRTIISNKPRSKYFGPVPALAKVLNAYDYPLTPGKMLMAKFEGNMYPALLVSIETSVEAAEEKVKMLRQQEQILAPRKRKEPTASSRKEDQKRQKLLGAELQQIPADDRNLSPREDANDRSAEIDSFVYSQNSVDRNVETEQEDIFQQESDALTIQRPRLAPIRIPKENSAKPANKGAAKLKPGQTDSANESNLVSEFRSGAAFSRKGGPVAVRSAVLSLFTPTPVPVAASVVSAAVVPQSSGPSASVSAKKPALPQPGVSSYAALPRNNASRNPYPDYQFPFEIEGTDKRLLVERTAGLPIFIDAAYYDYMKSKQQAGTALARKVIQRLLVGPGNDLRGMEILRRQRAKLLAAGVRQPGMNALLGDEFMTTFKMYCENMGHKTRGDWVSKSINQWKDFKFKKMDEEQHAIV